MSKNYTKQIEPKHFVFYNILSFTFYELVWMYRVWDFFKEKEKSDITPALRIIFAVIFVYPLFKKIRDESKALGWKQDFSPVGRAISWIAINMTALLTYPFNLLIIFTFIPLITPINAMNYYYQKKEGETIARPWLWWQYILVILGSLWWLLVVIGLVAELLL